jgi:hypothetical protein
MSVLPSVRVKQLGSHWTDFHEIRQWDFFFSKICPEISSVIKIGEEEERVLYMMAHIYFWSYLSHLLTIKNVSDKSSRENQNTF